MKRKNKKYYRKENAINIKVIGGYIKKDTEIKIIAVYPNGIEEQIGQSIICKNNINKYVVIRPVKMIWGGYYNIIEDYKPFIESFLSQALIKVKFLETEILNSNSKSKGKTFISRSKEYSDYFDYAKKNDYYRVENRDKEVEHLLETRNTIINYYNEFGASLPSKNRTKATIDDDWHKITYLIFTDLNSQTINEELEKEVIAELKALNLPIDKNIKYGSTTIAGVATQKDTGNYWGNGAILYKVITKDPIKNIRTLLHELGHTFGLRHIFEGESSGFTFYTGYSDNIMDYAFTTNKVFKIKVNPYVYDKGKEDIYTNHTLNKFQWELMTNDESINF